jgi:hypothetical protein
MFIDEAAFAEYCPFHLQWLYGVLFLEMYFKVRVFRKCVFLYFRSVPRSAQISTFWG